jgi:hypothetical protein
VIVEKKANIEIRINGRKGNLEVSPDTFDIKEIMLVLEQVESLLFPNDKTNRPTISYAIEQGSVRHVFTTSMQAVIAFNAIIAQVNISQNIDFLDLPTAKAIESFQNTALKKDYAFSISTSLPNTAELRIDKSTYFFRNASVWADAEFYFYGKIVNAGGKDKANIHVATDDFGTIHIETPIEFLEKQEANILYKTCGVRAIGKQHSETGEIDRTSLKFVEMVDYQTNFDEIYLTNLIGKASKKWGNIEDPDAWLRELRGGDYDT